MDHHALDSRIHEYFEKKRIQIILPLIFDNELLGILLFSRKKFSQEYTEDEIEIYNIFASNIAGSFQRNNIIRQMHDHFKEHFQLEKLAALGQLTAGIAHEIRNPLNTISTSAETLLQSNIGLDDQQELKQFIIEEVNRLNNILTDFLNLSRIKPPEFISLQAEELIEYLEMNLALQETENFQIIFSVNRPLASFISDPSILKQILLNLGLNAIAAIRERAEKQDDFSIEQGRLECRFEILSKRIHIYVTDNGIGIPDGLKENIFEPFFTTKESGTGLGLSIVQHLTEAIGGKISVNSKPGKTVFHIQIPKKIQQKKFGAIE